MEPEWEAHAPRRRGRRVWIATTLCLAACGGPVGPFAGGQLSGTQSEPPANWGAVPDTVQLEVRPAEPYSVNVWNVAVGSHLYVATRRAESTWRGVLQVDDRVRVRVADSVYALRAVAVRDARERARVVDAYLRKYGAPEEDASRFSIRHRRQLAMREALDETRGTIYRLQPR